MEARAYMYGNPNPDTPPFSDTHDWVYYYLFIHQLSPPSFRYAYVFWLGIALVLVLLSIGRLLGTGKALGALWSRWAIIRPLTGRNRSKKSNTTGPPPPPQQQGGGFLSGLSRSMTLRGSPASSSSSSSPTKKKKAGGGLGSSIPIYGELVALVILLVATVLLCFVGADYVSPQIPTFDFANNQLRRRGAGAAEEMVVAVGELLAPRDYTINPVSQPGYTIRKAWWTAGARTGLMAFALLPLVVLAALKAPPFALLAIRYPPFPGVHADKLMWLHRWGARLAYAVTVAHVVLWGVQLAKDKRTGPGGLAWRYVWVYDKFIFGIIAFVAMTLLIFTSTSTLRRTDYELFYALHVALVPITLVFSALHFPPIGWYCWSALILWVLERAWRLYKGYRVSGTLALDAKNAQISSPVSTPMPRTPVESEKSGRRISGYEHPQWMESTKEDLLTPTPTPATASSSRPFLYPPEQRSPGLAELAIPPGYARAELLPGRTIRLTVRTKKHLDSYPGQYALLTIPILSRFTSHPFTISSVSSVAALSASALESGEVSRKGKEKIPDGDQYLVFIIRARQGLTLDFWNYLHESMNPQLASSHHAPHLVSSTSKRESPLVSVRVDGAYGSAIKMQWPRFSTVLIVVGGSGIAFGLSVLEDLCQRMASSYGRFGREERRKKGWKGIRLNADRSDPEVHTNRIRFVWLVREYSHLTWCASTLKKCIESVPPEMLEIDIFVTNFQPVSHGQARGEASYANPAVNVNAGPNALLPPSPGFAKQRDQRGGSLSGSHSPSGSVSSFGSDSELSDSDADLTDMRFYNATRASRGGQPRRTGKDVAKQQYQNPDGDIYQGVYSDDSDGEDIAGYGRSGHFIAEELTNFDGEEDERLPGEARFSARIKTQGRHVRRKTLVDRVNHQPRSPSAAVALAPLKEQPGESVTADIVFSDPESAQKRNSDRSSVPLPLKLRTSSPPGTAAVPFVSPGAHRPHQRGHSARQSVADTLYSLNGQGSEDFHSVYDRPSSMQNLMSPQASSRPSTPGGPGQNYNPLFQLKSQDQEDLGYISALARPGRPRLDKIISDEVDKATGTIAVTCCGPSSLDNVMRRLAASHISAAKVWRGDSRGSLTFYTEEFSV